MRSIPDIGCVDPVVSKHASRRIRQRIGITKSGTERLARKAMADGITHAETRGSLNSYLTRLFMEHHNANNIRILCDYVYIFCGEILVTVFPLPQKYRRAVMKLRKRKEKAA